MCTLTIHQDPNRLLVTMNRDEARSRAVERPPQRRTIGMDAVEWLAPIDGESGGTWIGTNDRGVHAALLNQYLPTDAHQFSLQGHRISRGQIIVDLMAQGNEAEVWHWIDHAFDPTPFPSFLLVVMGRQGTRTISWDGGGLHREAHTGEWLLFTSSSWRSHDVAEYRRREFEAWVRQGATYRESIPAFHLLEPDGLLEWAPLMQREYSATRSITQIEDNFALRETELRHWSRDRLAPPWTPCSKLRITHT